MQETWHGIPPLGWEDLLEKGTATHSSTLAWRITWTAQPGGYGPQGRRVGHDWSDLALTHTCSLVLQMTNLENEVWSAAAAAKSLQSCPTLRLPCPWDSPGKNTGVGCHFLLQCMKLKSESEVAQSCPTLCDPMDCSPPGSSTHGIFQARVLEWSAIAFSEVWSR